MRGRTVNHSHLLKLERTQKGLKKNRHDYKKICFVRKLTDRGGGLLYTGFSCMDMP